MPLPKTIATICARGGSKGLPGKNIRDFAGKPLIVHSIEQALACPEIDAVYVSTDDEAIAAVAPPAGTSWSETIAAPPEGYFVMGNPAAKGLCFAPFLVHVMGKKVS